jgi:hypothetical protein
MRAGRSIAATVLQAALRLAPQASREWAEAMLRELDYIDGEWTALFWALGCTTAIFRQCFREWSLSLGRAIGNLLRIRSIQEGNTMNSTGKKTLGVLSGVGIALVLGVGAFFLSHPLAKLLASVGVPRTMWSHLLTILLPTELLLVGAAIWLWRRRTPMAVGILVTCAFMAIHVAVSLASR